MHMGQRKSGAAPAAGAGGGGPAPFLVKTYEMVDEKETQEVISWGEKGESFVVWKPAEFARDLLPLHFKHNNFSSFVRQLNTYGFHKVVPDRWEFTNENFRRGEQSLLCNIRRRKPSTAPASTSHLSSHDKATATARPPPPSSAANSGQLHASSPASSPPPADRLLQLADENEKLRKDNHVLSAELSQTKCRFRELLGFLSNYVDVNKLGFGRATAAVDGGGEGEEDTVAVEKSGGVKLFGVLLQGIGGKRRKRRRCDAWQGISKPLFLQLKN
ncbi:heat stress transcription factor B-1-like [Zingiber officinale]|nr:heat stress transcription factor B-1-like [Zingiber officinale]